MEQAEAWPILLYHQGMYYMLTGDAGRAKSIHHRLLALLPVKAHPDLSISVPHNLAVFCRRDGQTDSALYYYDQALSAAREQNETDWLATISMNIGVLHHTIPLATTSWLRSIWTNRWNTWHKRMMAIRRCAPFR